LSISNLTFSLLPITFSHTHASATYSIFNYWCYIRVNILLIVYCIDLIVVDLTSLHCALSEPVGSQAQCSQPSPLASFQ